MERCRALCTASRHVSSQVQQSEATTERIADLRYAIEKSAKVITTGTLDLGKEVPFLKPVCIALERIKESWDEIQRNEERLAELHEMCEVITAFVVVKCDGGRVIVHIDPLKDCVDDLEALVANYSRRGLCSKFCNQDSGTIERLGKRIERLVPVMGLAATVTVSEQMSEQMDVMGSTVDSLMGQLESNWARNEHLLARHETILTESTRDIERRFQSVLERLPAQEAKRDQAPEPKGIRKPESHVVRTHVVARVSGHFDSATSPWMVGLVGRSGAGKTSTAAEMAFQSHLRERFTDGIVWMRWGQGAAEPARLAKQMLVLAKWVHEDVENKLGISPSDAEVAIEGNAAAYIKARMEQGNDGQGLKCLVIADDVWELEVVDMLRQSGMQALITTRDFKLVEACGGKAIAMDHVTEEEGISILHNAAKLRSGESPPREASSILKLCDYVAMDLNFVGRWSMLRNQVSGAQWLRASDDIRSQMGPEVSESGEGPDDPEKRRAAILRAGYDDFGTEDTRNQTLYLSLAIMPNGRAFSVAEASLLLYGSSQSRDFENLAGEVVANLERWAILRRESTDGMYRMHDAHSDFARDILKSARFREAAVRRWSGYISCPQTVLSMDVSSLVGLWQAVDTVSGDESLAYSSYRTMLGCMGASDEAYLPFAKAVVGLYYAQGNDANVVEITQMMLDHSDVAKGVHPKFATFALWMLWDKLPNHGGAEKEEEILRKMGALMDEELLKQWADPDASGGEDAEWLHNCGLCLYRLEKRDESETYFRRALQAWEKAGLSAPQVQLSYTLHCLGRLAREAGRPQEAARRFRRALVVKERALGSGHLQVAHTLHSLGMCERDAGNLEEARGIFRRALEIKEATLAPDDAEIARTLQELNQCK